MAINIVSIRCPECGATLSIEEGRTKVFCSYCGANVAVSNDNEFIYRHIDETEIKRAEARKELKLKELELEKARYQQYLTTRQALIKVWLCSLAVVFIAILLFNFRLWRTHFGEVFQYALFGDLIVLAIGIYFIFKYLPERESLNAALRYGGVKVPLTFSYSSKNYATVESDLRGLGFMNITCINMHDVVLGILETAGNVKSVEANGKDIASFRGKVLSSDVPIVITYHGK